MTDSTRGRLAHVCDAELRSEDGLPPLAPWDETAGDLVGSGTGRVAGPRLRGTLRWSSFEHTAPDPCRLTLTGEIETDDGAVVRFESRGFVLPPAGGGTWKGAAAVRFVTEDPRYLWLQPLPALWEGEFDAATATARYRVYAPPGSLGEAGWFA